ncbi:MAG: MBOAT family O-acyltransferase [archaeon]
MLFNTFQFAVFMATVVLCLKIFRNRRLQLSLLVLASYVFYYYSSGCLFVLLLFSSLLDFYCGRKIFESGASGKRLFLVLSLAGNLGILGFFKYADFAIGIANQLRGIFGISPPVALLNIVLPVGISFFTFQTMSYTIDIYLGKLKPTESFLKFMLYVAFFPQLVAGPIVRAASFLPQLNISRISILPQNLKLGLTYIGWGLVKKVVFADNISPFVDGIFSDPTGLGSFPVMLGALGFGIQIYCDFSAYSDIAIGCARIMGFRFPKNFDKPYFARSPTDFWRRWHISLSSWLKDYIYIPLGGNRKGAARSYANVMVTMLLGGLWHGASWNFVIWGFYHGVLLAAHKLFSRAFPGHNGTRLTRVLSVFATQYFIFLGWLIFRVKNMDHLGYSVLRFIVPDFKMGPGAMALYVMSNLWPVCLIVMFMYLHFFSYKTRDIIRKIAGLSYIHWFLFIAFAALLLFLFAPSINTAFIYFQF